MDKLNLNEERRELENNLYERLPGILKTVTTPFSGRERDVVLLSSLGVLSNCIPNVYGTYDGKTIYPHLFVIIIAPPASGKGVMNYSRHLIEKIHKKVLEISRQQKDQCTKDKKGSKDKKQNFESCPEIEIKILPANISTSEMYSYLGRAKNGLLIIESEADTMGNMLKNDWGNYSDLLRKAFHHEPVSISRKMEGVFVEIDQPKLAFVMSGTPNQLLPLIQSKENGLFSRLMIYNFEDISEFKDVFAPNLGGIKEIFQSVGDEVFEMYGKLLPIKEPIEFKFKEIQKIMFFKRFGVTGKEIIENHTDSFLPNMFRHGLIMFRTAMILTVLRNIDNLENQEVLTCSQEDYDCALEIAENSLAHALLTYNLMDDKSIPKQDKDILNELPPNFQRFMAITVAEKFDMPIRTLDDKLCQWQEKKIIKKVKTGHYGKL